MNINWFSPISPAKTDIAYYTARVLKALSARAQITLWTDCDEWDVSLKTYADVQVYKSDEMR